MQATNAPVRRARPEMHTADIAIEQKPVIESRDDLVDEIVIASPEVLAKDYQDALAFAEQPVKIRIERSSEKFAPKAIDLWANGIGAEMLVNGKWVVYGYLPVGVPVITKRKYVEILARSKVDSIQTHVKEEESEHPKNEVERFTSSKAPFSVLEDRDPRGAAWLTSLVRFG